MRIVYIHQHFRTPEMSGGTRSYEFARRLVARGHEVFMVTADSSGTAAPAGSHRTSVEAGITVYWCNVAYGNAMPAWRRILAFLQFVAVSSRLAARLPQDVVLATSTPLTVSLPGAWSAFRNRVPMVFEVRDLWPHVPIALGALRGWPVRKAAEWLERWSYRRADRLIALSPDMARGILRVRPDAEVTVIPNASDLELFGSASEDDAALLQEHPWVAERPVVLYAGTFGRANGVGYLVDVAEGLRQRMPSAAVVLIGSGAEFEQTRRRAEDRGLLGVNCFVLGNQPKSRVAAWFRACAVSTSVFIDEPALAANSPNKVFDALAAGRPVAVNNGGWIAELLTEYGAGISLPPGRPADAAVLLAELLSDVDRLRTTGEAARRLAADRFDRDKLYAEFESVLTSAVAPGRPA